MSYEQRKEYLMRSGSIMCVALCVVFAYVPALKADLSQSLTVLTQRLDDLQKMLTKRSSRETLVSEPQGRKINLYSTLAPQEQESLKKRIIEIDSAQKVLNIENYSIAALHFDPLNSNKLFGLAHISNRPGYLFELTDQATSATANVIAVPNVKSLNAKMEMLVQESFSYFGSTAVNKSQFSILRKGGSDSDGAWLVQDLPPIGDIRMSFVNAKGTILATLGDRMTFWNAQGKAIGQGGIYGYSLLQNQDKTKGALSPDGTLFAATTILYDNGLSKISIIKIDDGQVQKEINYLPNDPASYLFFHPITGDLIVIRRFGKVQWYDGLTFLPKADKRLSELKDFINLGPVTLSPDGQWLAALMTDMNGANSLGLWNVETGTLARSLTSRNGFASVAFSNDNKRLSIGSLTGEVIIWDQPEMGW